MRKAIIETFTQLLHRGEEQTIRYSAETNFHPEVINTLFTEQLFEGVPKAVAKMIAKDVREAIIGNKKLMKELEEEVISEMISKKIAQKVLRKLEKPKKKKNV